MMLDSATERAGGGALFGRSSPGSIHTKVVAEKLARARSGIFLELRFELLRLGCQSCPKA
jgi:hypothetical protein